MPGWSKMSYYQGGAIPEIFDRKFKEVCKLPRHKETTWTLCYHVYRDNQDEIERAKRLAEDNGLKFIALPSIFMPLEKIVDRHYTEKDYQLLARLLETPDEAISRMKFSTDYCYLWKQITIDAFGMVYLCQLIYEDRFKLMPFLEWPLEAIQKAMRGHTFCQKCMKSGAHQYEACYADFTKYKDPVGEANRKRLK
jgi:MoaA/NifB/PqqE/SkfB family radical SAM enzyme